MERSRWRACVSKSRRAIATSATWQCVTPAGISAGSIWSIHAAEIGRHLAILGSCAAARANQVSSQHYYLAWKADLRQAEHVGQLAHRDAQLLAQDLIGCARAEFSDKRTARAETQLIHQPTGKKLYDLSVEYKVLTPRLFERMYSDRRIATPVVEFNPYAADLLGLGDVFVLDDLLSANLQTLDPISCAGHFPNYPALPVAILAHILISAAGKLFGNIVGNDDAPYTVAGTLVEADHLAFPNDKLHVVIQHKNSDDDGPNRLFRGRALSEGKENRPFGDLQITLREVE